MMASYDVESVVRGHHVYKTVWQPDIGEKLALEQERNNPHDKYTVSVKKEDIIVGHVPREHSKLFWHFIQHSGIITCCITGKRKKGIGLEVPCTYSFRGKKSLVDRMKQLSRK